MYTGAMETTTQGTNECQGGMSDPAAMPHLILDSGPGYDRQHCNHCDSRWCEGGTVQMLSLDEEVQISSVQIQAVGADDDFTANPLQVQG